MKILLLLLSLFASPATQAQNCIVLFAKTQPPLQVIRTEKVLTIEGQQRKLQIFKPDTFSGSHYRVLIYFHGTNSIVDIDHPLNAPYGTFSESQFIKKMVEQGYIVIAPESNSLPGFIPYTFIPTSYKAWEANIYPYSENFENSRDALLIETLLSHTAEIVDRQQSPRQIFVGGFSSGGYMASRVGNIEHFASSIDGLIINAASYGTCLAASCSIPSELPSWHPKTLLLSNNDDSIVPHSTVEKYAQTLDKNGIRYQTIYNETGDHSWLPSQVDSIIHWIKTLEK